MKRSTAWRIGAAAALLFFLRGIFVVGLAAPFEGWDEHQHLAYVVFLDEEGRRPVSGRDVVPASLHEALRSLPHSYWGAGNVESVGGRNYRAYWEESAPTQDSPEVRIPLYQAQHGPLAYLILLPAFRAAGGLDDTLHTIAVLRLVNLLLASIGILLVASTICLLLSEARHARWVALACTANPLLLMNAARISNDAAAFLLGTAAVCLILRSGPSPTLRRLFVLGLVVGASILAKLTNAPVVLAALLAIVWDVRGGQRWLRSAMIRVLILSAGILCVCGWEFVENIRHHGTPVAERRTVAASESDADVVAYVTALTRLDWLVFLRARLAQGSLWLGGWSYGRIPSPFTLVYLVWLAAVGAALLLSCLRKRAGPSLQGRDPNARVLFLGGAYLAALCTHALLSYIGEDVTTPRTNVFYAAVVFPWFYLLLLRGGQWRAPFWLVAGLLLLFGVAELWGHVLVQAPTAAATADPELVWERLNALHPAWMGPGVSVAALVAYAFALVRFLGKDDRDEETETVSAE